MGGLESAASQPDRVRLHITPLNAEIYNRIIPPSLQPLASDASFHNIQTFPERDYGFVELPAMEAQKLKKKLNGSTLKGSKMSVEEARPLRKRKPDSGVDVEEGERKKAKREKNERRKKEDGVLLGHELEEGRRIKRGWSGNDSKDEKGKGRRRDSKELAHDQDEDRTLRFKTKLPANKASVADKAEKKKKDRKDKKKGTDQTVVEEFTKRRKSRQDIALPNTAKPGSRSYREGKGWVDENGHIVETERKSKRQTRQPSVSPDDSSLPVDDEAALGAVNDRPHGENVTTEPAQQQSSDVQSSDESDDDKTPDPSNETTEAPKEVHPLEALFKRPAPGDSSEKSAENSVNITPNKPRPAPIDTSFSFFGSGGGDTDNDVEMDEGEGGNGAAKPPVTPHTKQDLEWRSLRSAAPTPDTAAIGRKFSFPFADHDLDEEDEDEDEDEDMDVGQGQEDEEQAMGEPGLEAGVRSSVRGNGQGKEESAFRKWFFENRGDLNRGWKKRRREERKVKRQRENRRLGRKVA